MRIRTIKPEFWQSENMASVSRDARLVAIALLNYADDDGLFLANERVFRGALFPFDDDLDILGAFQELSMNGWVVFADLSENVLGTLQESSENVPGTFQERSKKILGKIQNFKVHQRIDKPQKSRFNAENAVFGPLPGTFQERSKNAPRTFQEPSTNVPGVLQESSKTEVEVERDVEVEKEKERLSLPSRAREPRPLPATEPADDLRTPPDIAHQERQATWSKRRQAWLKDQGAVDFATQPGPLLWISYCRAVHPSWQDKPARKAYDTLVLHGWSQGGRKINSWWKVADAWAENADHSEFGERHDMGGTVARLGISGMMDAREAGIVSGEAFT